MWVVFFEFVFSFFLRLFARYRFIIKFVGGWRNGIILVLVYCLFFVVFFGQFGGVCSRSVRRLFLLFLAVLNVRFEQVGNVSYVLRFQLFFIKGRIICKRWVQEVLCAIIMVHTDVLESEIDFNEVVGQIR